MRRLTPDSHEIQQLVIEQLLKTTPEQRQLWRQSPVTAGAFGIIERIRMECLEQAEDLPQGDMVMVLTAQAQVLKRLAVELDTAITEAAEYEYDDTDDDDHPGGSPPRRGAHYPS